MTFIERLGVSVPVVQAPMAGVSTTELAAAVSNAGGLGSIGLGATNSTDARAMVEELYARTDRAFNVNLFVHRPATPNVERERDWIEWLGPAFAELGVEPPKALRPLFKSFIENDDMLAMLLETRPPVVSFHFGLPPDDVLSALRMRGITLLATATSLDEARAIEKAGIDAIVAQGIEAGGHRGMFDPAQTDDALGSLALTRLLVQKTNLPVIAAGGIMDGADIAAVLNLGAAAAQLGTAFITCPESAANDAYRTLLTGPAAQYTALTSVISGRPARAMANRLMTLSADIGEPVPPDFPIAFAASKALNAAAQAQGVQGFGAYWAGEGASRIRPMPAAMLVEMLHREIQDSLGEG